MKTEDYRNKLEFTSLQNQFSMAKSNWCFSEFLLEAIKSDLNT